MGARLRARAFFLAAVAVVDCAVLLGGPALPVSGVDRGLELWDCVRLPRFRRVRVLRGGGSEVVLLTIISIQFVCDTLGVVLGSMTKIVR